MQSELAPHELQIIPDALGLGLGHIGLHVAKMAMIARSDLVTRAQKGLFTSARDYVRGIQPLAFEQEGQTRLRGILQIVGAVPYMVEHGKEAWDLRTTILKPGTRRLRTSKAGYYYVCVPFRHMTPGASGKNAPAMGSQFTQDSLRPESLAHRGDLTGDEARKLGRAVHRAAKGLAPTVSAPGTKPTYGGRLEAGVGGAAPLRARHVSDPFAGMVREEKTYESGTQSQYMTWRVISNDPATFRSDEGGRNWTHPGIKARGLLRETKTKIENLIQAGVFGG